MAELENPIQEYEFFKQDVEFSFTNKVESSLLYKFIIAAGICAWLLSWAFLGFGIHFLLFGSDYALLATGELIAGIFLAWYLGYYLPHALIRYFVIETVTSTINTYVDEIISVYKVIINGVNQISDAEEILQKMQTMPKLFRKLKRIRGYISFFDSDNSRTLSHIQENDQAVIMAVIQDMISDLQLRLEEQQKTLEQAKSEVEQNIHGTSELNQVSELQRARLDQQIEQFKELQRVLVKNK